MTDASFWGDLIAPSFTSSGISHPLSFNPFSSFTPQFTPQFTPHDVSFSWQPSAPYRQTWTADEQKSDELATVFGVGLEQDRAFSETSGGHPGLGEFVVGDRGQLQIDLVFDGGSYAGQLAVFSLIGMETLRPGSLAYIQEATRRALSQSHQGYGIVSDTEGAKLTGSVTGALTPAPRPPGSPSNLGHAGPSLTPGDRMAFMLIPNGTVQAAFSAAIAADLPNDLRPLFSVAAANPGGLAQFVEVADGVFSIEDLRRDSPPGQRPSDEDFDDFIFAVGGASGQLGAIAEQMSLQRNWLKPSTIEILAQHRIPARPPVAEPEPSIPEPSIPEPYIPEPPTPLPQPPAPPIPPLDPPPPPSESESESESEPEPEPLRILKAIASTQVVKFYNDLSETEIAALAPPQITLGSQRIYIGTQQVTPINQNPIIRAFDSLNPANNWNRTDYEITGTDGRGMGLFWSGSGLYAVFTVDGTQGTPDQDFRRASGGAEQVWLRSYGQGGGGKISVIGRIDPKTGNLLAAAHLSAVLNSGNSNSFTVEDINLNSNGNLVIRAAIAFGPRNPDGSRMRQLTTASSPFDYTLEITPDLKRVVRTSAEGWVAS